MATANNAIAELSGAVRCADDPVNTAVETRDTATGVVQRQLQNGVKVSG